MVFIATARSSIWRISHHNVVRLTADKADQSMDMEKRPFRSVFSFIRKAKATNPKREKLIRLIYSCVLCARLCARYGSEWDTQHLCSIEYQLYAYCISLQLLRMHNAYAGLCIQWMQFWATHFYYHIGIMHCPTGKLFRCRSDDSLPFVECIVSDCVECTRLFELLMSNRYSWIGWCVSARLCMSVWIKCELVECQKCHE